MARRKDDSYRDTPGVWSFTCRYERPRGDAKRVLKRIAKRREKQRFRQGILETLAD